MKKYLKFADLAMAALGVIALIMLFLPAISYKFGNTTTSYNGWNLIFGYSETSEFLGATTSISIFKFSFLNLITLLLIVGTIACAVLSYVMKNELFYLISAACALVGGIFCFLIKTFAITADTTTEAVMDKFSLSAGPIIAAILLFLAVACGVVKKVLDK